MNIVDQGLVAGTAVAQSRIGARFDCTCYCTGGDWRLFGLLIVTGEINLPRVVERTPCVDKSVRDTASAKAHEYGWHIDPAIEAAQRFVQPFEKKAYASEGECKGTCNQLKSSVPARFRDKLRQTQVEEVRRCR
ncbi:MAG: hypothetical protein QM736_14160 [Vicinamibacterales bacterium]